MLERSFLDALRLNPVDDCSRLACAGWLADHGDPRADLLRLDLEWFNGRRTLLRLREAARAAGLAWLAVVSLIARLVESFWARACGTFTALDIGVPLPWSQAELQIRSMFAARAVPLDEAFVVPLDFALFQAQYPGRWARIAPGGPLHLHDPHTMIQSAVSRYQDPSPWAFDRPEIRPAIGQTISGDEEHHLCRDKASRHFGQMVTAGYRNHPADFALPLFHPRSPACLEFLRSLATPRDGP